MFLATAVMAGCFLVVYVLLSPLFYPPSLPRGFSHGQLPVMWIDQKRRPHCSRKSRCAHQRCAEVRSPLTRKLSISGASRCRWRHRLNRALRQCCTTLESIAERQTHHVLLSSMEVCGAKLTRSPTLRPNPSEDTQSTVSFVCLSNSQPTFTVHKELERYMLPSMRRDGMIADTRSLVTAVRLEKSAGDAPWKSWDQSRWTSSPHRCFIINMTQCH